MVTNDDRDSDVKNINYTIAIAQNFCDEDFHKLHTMMKISVKKIPCKQP